MKLSEMFSFPFSRREILEHSKRCFNMSCFLVSIYLLTKPVWRFSGLKETGDVDPNSNDTSNTMSRSSTVVLRGEASSVSYMLSLLKICKLRSTQTMSVQMGTKMMG